MAQWWKDEIQARCPQADGFVGVSGYEDIAQVIAQALEDQHPAHFGDIDAPVPETDRVVCTSDYWAWLRIAEGCDNRCAYCIIPFIRGKFRSRPEEAILAEAQDLAQAGMQELIVVAQDITRYGLDLYGERTLAKLLPKLCAIEGIHWVRLHYLYPDEITDELIDVIANEPKIVKYLDIPIQHISDRLLKSMHRRGTGEEIRALFRKLRERIPAWSSAPASSPASPGRRRRNLGRPWTSFANAPSPPCTSSPTPSGPAPRRPRCPARFPTP